MRNGAGLLVLLTCLVAPGLIAAYFLHSTMLIIAIPAALIVLMLVVAALPIKRRTTPQEWADVLERHLLGQESSQDWDDATSVALADEQLESLRFRLSPEFDSLDTPKKAERFRQIIEALRRGEVP